MAHERLLLVDDDRHILEAMGSWLREQGFEVDTARTVRAAREGMQQNQYDLMLIDIRLEDADGFELLAQARQVQPESEVILVTGYGTAETAIEALRAGAFDLLTKPLLDEELLASIRRALAQRRVREENRQLKAQLDFRSGLDQVLGTDPRMRRVFELVESVADTRATVLITGESGTGKSLIARAIHRSSARRDGPFIEVACGALPDTLLESELFGHVAGAFTGAVSAKIGKFKQADGGTIFLDEIGTASPSMQVKLLRVLQEFAFEPLGSTQTHRVDTRVILATNEDLAAAVASGRFRQDLYYRVNVINIELPPLRERTQDIPLLANHFLQRFCEDLGKGERGFTPEAMDVLQGYAWPGNIRELQNVVERAVLLGRGSRVEPQDLGHLSGPRIPASRPASPSPSLKEALTAPERQIILDMLEAHQWNRHATAEALGINRTTLYKKMKKLGLDDPRQGKRHLPSTS